MYIYVSYIWLNGWTRLAEFCIREPMRAPGVTKTKNFGTSTNVGPTNVGLYKGRTVQTSDLQTPDWYKRRTETNVGLVQTSDQYKCRTGTFIRKNVGLWLNFKERPLL